MNTQYIYNIVFNYHKILDKHIKPFEKLIKDDVPVIMIGHIIIRKLTNLLPATDINKVIVVAYDGFGLEVVAVILGIMGLKGNKTVAVIAIVIGAIIGGFTLLGGFGLQIMTKATDCVPSKTEGTYVCKYAGADLEVPGEYLRDDQIKKGE